MLHQAAVCKQRPGIAVLLLILASFVSFSLPVASARRMLTTPAEPAVNSSDLAQVGPQLLVGTGAVDAPKTDSIRSAKAQVDLPLAAAVATVASLDPSTLPSTAAVAPVDPVITNPSQVPVPPAVPVPEAESLLTPAAGPGVLASNSSGGTPLRPHLLTDPRAVNAAEANNTQKGQAQVDVPGSAAAEAAAANLDPGVSAAAAAAAAAAASAVTCSRPPTNPPNAMLRCASTSAVGTACTATCNNGFKAGRRGAPRVTCGATGSWSAIRGRCIAASATCSTIPVNPANGTFSCPRNSSVGRSCIGTCSSGFTGTPRVTCQANGTWGGTNGNCSQVVCFKRPSNPPHATFSCISNITSGTTCTSTCNANFTAGSSGAPRVTCAADGSWSALNGSCIPVCSARPLNPPNATFSCSSNSTNGTVCIATCDSGSWAGQSGAPRVICQQSDTTARWSTVNGSCTEAPFCFGKPDNTTCGSVAGHVCKVNVCAAASALPSPTHSCSLLVNVMEQQTSKQQAVNISCHRQPTAPADCNLLLYYNSTGMFKDGTTNMAGLIKPPFGIPAGQLPSPVAPWDSAEFSAIEIPLNRTEPLYNGTIWPMLFFFGGSTCHVVLTNPQITGCQLKAGGGAPALLAFGGGLTATVVGGSIIHTAAYMAVVALANTTLSVHGTYLGDNKLDAGALYASWRSTLRVSDAKVQRNTARSHGPALYAAGAKVVIKNSKFEYNVADEGGGAMYLKFSNLTMSSTRLTNNAAPTGGALAVYNDTSLSIEGCDFLENTARIVQPDNMQEYYKLGVGGAVYIEHSNADFVATNFSNNRAVMDGGAVRMHVAHVNMTHSYLGNNRAHRNGGAVFVGTMEWDRSINSTLWLVNTTFESNTAEATGGVVMLERRAHCYVSGGTIKDCKAWSSGGGISTVMAGGDNDDTVRVDDLATSIVVNNVSFTGGNKYQRLLVGPYFTVKLNVSDFNYSSPGVIWRRRLCGKGEYLSPSEFCEQCPPYQYSTLEASPGHSERQCWAAPSTAYAPGGAVLVPLSGSWHGVRGNSFATCAECPELNATLGDIRRCPNPAACEHNVTLLARVHPDSNKAPPIPWSDYGAQLCNYQDGYQGILCGSSCIKGFGVTAPFKCNRCLGVAVTPSVATGYTAGKLPGPSRISAVYFVYWFVLTCWLLYTVRSFVRVSNPQPQQAGEAAAAAAGPKEHRLGHKDASNMDRDTWNEYAPDRQHADASMAQENSPLGGTVKEFSRSIDITKVLIIYTQWVMLVINLPVTWLPWAAHSSTSAAGNSAWEQDTTDTSTTTKGFTDLVDGALGVVFGRSASMDCFLQAWGILQDNTMEAVVKNIFARAVGSAIVVPLVLFLSVLLFQLMLFALRHPLLKLLDRLSKSEFFRDKVSFIEKGVAGLSGTSLPSVASGTASSWTSAPHDPSSQNVAGVPRSPSFWSVLADNLVATVLAVSMFVYMPVARVAFSMLLCVKVAGSDRWVLDVRLQCPAIPPYTSWGVGALMLGVFLLVLCVAWPVGIAWVLICKGHRGKLLHVSPHHATSQRQGAGVPVVSAGGSAPGSTTANLAMRYADYAVDYGAMQLFKIKSESVGLSGWQWLRWLSKQSFVHYRMHVILVWDSVLDFHRLTIALVSLCVMLHEGHQIALMIVVLGSYLLAVLLVQPWRARAVWQLQVAALAVLIASCLGIMASTVQNASAYYSNPAIQRYSVVIPWLVIAVNVVYLVTVLVMLARCVMQEVPSISEFKALWIQNKQQAAKARVMHGRMDARSLDGHA